MQKLAEVCIRRPVFAAMLILALVVVGSVAYGSLGIDRFPSVDLPTVSVRAVLPGGAPEDVETEVTEVIETAVNTVEGIRELRSITAAGSAVVIATYALCGFANFSSIAIQIGGIGGLAPERRGDLSRLGLRAMIAGTLASFMTAAVVGVLL